MPRPPVAADVRVGTGAAEERGDCRVRKGKFPGELPQVLEFVLIIPVEHDAAPFAFIRSH